MRQRITIRGGFDMRQQESCGDRVVFEDWFHPPDRRNDQPASRQEPGIPTVDPDTTRFSELRWESHCGYPPD